MPTWPPELAGRVKALIADRAALATAVIATSEPASGRRFGSGLPLLARYHRATGEMTWFESDDDTIWWCVRQDAVTKKWQTPRIAPLDPIMQESLESLDRLKAEAEAPASRARVRRRAR